MKSLALFTLVMIPVILVWQLLFPHRELLVLILVLASAVIFGVIRVHYIMERMHARYSDMLG